MSPRKRHRNQVLCTSKLLVIPGRCESSGDTLAFLTSLLEGFAQCGAVQQICVLVQAGSPLEQELADAGLLFSVQSIPVRSASQFLTHALQWVNQQPAEWPLLLDNWRPSVLWSTLILAAPRLCWSNRQVYHFYRDTALLQNPGLLLLQKLAFLYLAHHTICSSYFTAWHIARFTKNLRGILYPPVENDRGFNPSRSHEIPEPLATAIRTGAKIILAPYRCKTAQSGTDQSLMALIPMIVYLHSQGHSYHIALISEDEGITPGLVRKLRERLKQIGGGTWVTVLPSGARMSDYYSYTEVVVALSPQEPCGRVVVEAITAGVPVVGSQTGGIGEILSHFAPEWSVDATDPIVVAETILHLNADLNTPQKLVCGQEWIRMQGTLADYARKMMMITKMIPDSSRQWVRQGQATLSASSN
ncbi:glycosyltransferase [Leptolyngbya sp. 'hensonii']|uniref:glycosyltransferase n=1 Tax=Leptolyngbya sp. 'hensonii' TaxID=1922337 RepID=UPI0015C55DF5|nr:glycosyltransferase [Leptolyngbya sp. 'hensonii']